MRILLTGATGFVGTSLCKKLLSDGHELHILTRGKNDAVKKLHATRVHTFTWSDTSKLPPIESIQGIDGVINLIGENIAAKRWSDEQKKTLHTSRVEATENLASLIDQNLTRPLEFFISSSAVGIYPVNTDKIQNEDSSLGNNFLAKLCIDWEAAAHTLKQTKRLVIIRTAVVLEQGGGALKKMLPPFKMGVGGPIGNGDHFMSWIHLDDLVNLYATAATNPDYTGIFNGAAPHPINNFDFTKALGKALHRPTLIPVPVLPLKIAFGEMASVILDSQKIISKRLPEKGFVFKYETVEEAMNAIFRGKP